MKSHILAICFLLLGGVSLFAQTAEHVTAPNPGEVTIGAVHVEREGTVFNINYKVLLGEGVQWCKVRLLLSTDGGKTFSNVPTQRSVTGDVGKVSEGGNKTIFYDVTNDKQQLADKPLAFKVDIHGKNVIQQEYFILGTASVYPNLSYGLMVGSVKKFGWYLKARSNFKFPSTSYECESDGIMPSGGTIWSNGCEQKSRYVITAGMIVHATNWLYPYVGAGYGSKQLCWQDTQNEWVKVSDISYQGVSLDAGLLFKFGKVAISAAVCNTPHKSTEGEISIGMIF